METTIFIGGLYNVGFAIFHLAFWKLFKWNDELKKLSFANKAILQILNLQITCYFIFVAIACFVFPAELVSTKLGHFVLGGTSLFWLIRTIQQFIFLRKNNYKIHLLTIIFLAGTILFALPIVK